MIKHQLLYGIILYLVNRLNSSGLKFVEVSPVKVENGSCFYKGQNFSSVWLTNGTVCEEWLCNTTGKSLTLVGCAPDPPGCTRNTSAVLKYPQCCATNCVQKREPYCLADDGTPVPEGLEYNSTSPCVRYGCENGTLTTLEECPKPEAENDPLCQPSYVEKAPFPACCGAATLCISSGKGRRK
uniref:Single domain-containing protein n=1 Tax=Amblyomma triste TaxID=251400 RepID=A0A023GA76_AMBTT